MSYASTSFASTASLKQEAVEAGPLHRDPCMPLSNAQVLQVQTCTLADLARLLQASGSTAGLLADLARLLQASGSTAGLLQASKRMRNNTHGPNAAEIAIPGPLFDTRGLHSDKVAGKQVLT